MGLIKMSLDVIWQIKHIWLSFILVITIILAFSVHVHFSGLQACKPTHDIDFRNRSGLFRRLIWFFFNFILVLRFHIFFSA